MALPLTRATGLPRFVPSTSNWIEPVAVGMALPDCGVTVAVNVTDWPETDVGGAAVTVVLVLSSWPSKAPMSTLPSTIRGSPRWSVVSGFPFASTARATLPASMAGLLGNNATVCVGPPLLAGRPRPESETLNWLWLAAVRVPVSSLPTRL